MPVPSQAGTSVTGSGNGSYVPKEKATEQATDVPADDPVVAPESTPIEIETVSEPQSKGIVVTPHEPQYEVEITPPTTDEEDPSDQEETPTQTPSEPSDPQPEAEPTIPQTEPPEVPSEPKIQDPTESVDDCITYGKEYAISIGLALDNTAVECWDTPITSSDPYYIKRDIRSRLNRYKNHEDVTDIWIWKEPVGNGRYKIYIGYA